MGLVSPKSFNIILIEFSPRDIRTYTFPLKVIFNHDPHSMHSVLLHGSCCDPFIEIENINNDEIYFSPSSIGISTVKSVNIINKSPVKIDIQIPSIKNTNTGQGQFNTENNTIYYEKQ